MCLSDAKKSSVAQLPLSAHPPECLALPVGTEASLELGQRVTCPTWLNINPSWFIVALDRGQPRLLSSVEGDQHSDQTVVLVSISPGECMVTGLIVSDICKFTQVEPCD